MIKNDEIILSNGELAKLVTTNSSYQNILIVQLNGILRVIDKETKTLARPLGGIQNNHEYDSGI